ncbi:MAG: S8 family serine peptidase [Gammaproteobacteria bacterium]|nr:S8 family serine peptidase [Gammaproteobacteria bacterium]
MTIVLMFVVAVCCAQSSTDPACTVLGPKPSFIVKLRSSPPLLLAREQLASGDLHRLAAPGLIFTQAKRMFQGYYVVHVKAEKQSQFLLQANASGFGCYSKQSLSRMVAKIKQSPLVAEVTPNFLSTTMVGPQSHMPAQWNLQGPPGGIDAENTWIDFTSGHANTTIAVLDTGIMNHEALNPNILPGVHFTDAGSTGMSATPSCIACAGYHHGTMVAGIIASTGALAYGETLWGVAPHTSILPINVFTKFTDEPTCGMPPCLYSYLSDQINALEWLAGIDFPDLNPPPASIVGINMSLGNVRSCPDVAQRALNQTQKRGLVTMVAAGNRSIDAARDYPANCDGVISVAATGFYGERASYSNWGKSVTIAAPGGNGSYSVYATIDNAYAHRQATSFAVAHVSGVVALLYAIDPTLRAEQVKQIITAPDTITPFPSADMLPEGAVSCMDDEALEKYCGAGIINAYKAAQKVYTRLHDK